MLNVNQIKSRKMRFSSNSENKPKESPTACLRKMQTATNRLLELGNALDHELNILTQKKEKVLMTMQDPKMKTDEEHMMTNEEEYCQKLPKTENEHMMINKNEYCEILPKILLESTNENMDYGALGDYEVQSKDSTLGKNLVKTSLNNVYGDQLSGVFSGRLTSKTRNLQIKTSTTFSDIRTNTSNSFLYKICLSETKPSSSTATFTVRKYSTDQLDSTRDRKQYSLGTFKVLPKNVKECIGPNNNDYDDGKFEGQRLMSETSQNAHKYQCNPIFKETLLVKKYFPDDYDTALRNNTKASISYVWDDDDKLCDASKEMREHLSRAKHECIQYLIDHSQTFEEPKTNQESTVYATTSRGKSDHYDTVEQPSKMYDMMNPTSRKQSLLQIKIEDKSSQQFISFFKGNDKNFKFPHSIQYPSYGFNDEQLMDTFESAKCVENYMTGSISEVTFKSINSLQKIERITNKHNLYLRKSHSDGNMVCDSFNKNFCLENIVFKTIEMPSVSHYDQRENTQQEMRYGMRPGNNNVNIECSENCNEICNENFRAEVLAPTYFDDIDEGKTNSIKLNTKEDIKTRKQLDDTDYMTVYHKILFETVKKELFKENSILNTNHDQAIKEKAALDTLKYIKEMLSFYKENQLTEEQSKRLSEELIKHFKSEYLSFKEIPTVEKDKASS